MLLARRALALRCAPALAFASALALAAPRAALAQAAPAGGFALRFVTGQENPARALVGVNHDDDDDDGVPDGAALERSDPAWDDDLVRVDVVSPAAPRGALTVRVTGGLRVRASSGGAGAELSLEAPQGRASFWLSAVAPSERADDATLTVRWGGQERSVAVTAVVALWLDGDNAPLRGSEHAARVSQRITNDDTLPRVARWETRSGDLADLRAAVWDPSARVGSVRVDALGTAASVGLGVGVSRGALREVLVEAPREGLALRGRFVRLVADEVDRAAPGVNGQTVRVGLRDALRVRYERPERAGFAAATLRVGRPGNDPGPYAALRGVFRPVLLRDRRGGRVLFGGDEAGALRLVREQVQISNEAYLQCGVTFGDATTLPVLVADPPPVSLLAVGDDDGLLAAGGEVRLRANGRRVGPVRVPAGARPEDTAALLAEALRAAGFDPRVTRNRVTDYGAHPSADVLVRDARGRLVELAPERPGAALSTDPQQTVQLGRVDLSDGLEEFNNLNSAAGTLEERALLKALVDDDPSTIDVLFINRFTNQTRIGEAFVEGDGAALVNHLVIDRGGLVAQREAWTQAHEAGHVLLNQPWHPDNMGPDRPWLLMDSDASLGTVQGPKRLEPSECARMRTESGPRAVPALLRPYDPSPRVASDAEREAGGRWFEAATALVRRTAEAHERALREASGGEGSARARCCEPAGEPAWRAEPL